MSLREALRATVARCAPQQMQPATLPTGHAAGYATAVQQVSAAPMEAGPLSATSNATDMQQGAETDATRGPQMPLAPHTSCNWQPSALTAHRVTADLIQAAMRVCDGHGDNEVQREEMRRDCLRLPPELQADLLAHFRGGEGGRGHDRGVVEMKREVSIGDCQKRLKRRL